MYFTQTVISFNLDCTGCTSTSSTRLFRSSCTNSEDWKSPVLCSVDAAYCQVTDAIGSMSSVEMSVLYMAEVRSIYQGLLWTLQVDA